MAPNKPTTKPTHQKTDTTGDTRTRLDCLLIGRPVAIAKWHKNLSRHNHKVLKGSQSLIIFEYQMHYRIGQQRGQNHG